MPCLGFLAELLLAEWDDRAHRRSEGRVKQPGSPATSRSLRNFYFDANSNLDPPVIHALAKANGSRTPAPLPHRDFGTGKSHLLIALGTEAAMAGYRVKYVLATKLANELAEAADENS